MRAKIVDNLMDVIDDFFEGQEGSRTDPEFIALCNRISGKEVELVFTGPDAFEKIDNNYWLPDCCWKEIKSSVHMCDENCSDSCKKGVGHGND